ncbi:hypothetical protein ABPG75_013165 [Micractinium tetrahymenae]
MVPLQPGNDLLRARAQQAAALPSEERSRDVEDFVQRSALWDAALDLLVPARAAPAAADPTKASPPVARGLALALKGMLLFPNEVAHYQGYMRAFSAGCYPFRLAEESDGFRLRLDEAIRTLRGASGRSARAASERLLAVLLRAAMACFVCTHESSIADDCVVQRQALAVALEMERHGTCSELAAVHAQQLDLLQAELPPEQRLRLAELLELGLFFQAAAMNYLCDGSSLHDQLVVSTLAGEYRLPASAFGPRPSEVPRAMLAACQRLLEGLAYQEQALALAEEQDRPYWLAKAAYDLCEDRCLSAASGTWPATVAEVEALLRKGDAALKRCKKHLPQMSYQALVQSKEKEAGKALRLVRRAAPTGGAIPSSVQLTQAIRQATEDADFEQPTCSGCGKPSLELRACSSCRLARYCGRECQLAHWKEHKAACKAARKG